jgi:S1-C subfamily serine protease
VLDFWIGRWEVRDAAGAAARSTVELVGAGCGGELVGSGWVAAPDLVVTNAHVVAGIAAPFVRDADGTHRAVPVLFDPDTDIAILRVGGLAGPPLAVASTDPGRGAVGAVLGYPGGGPLTVGSAAVRGVSVAEGRDIYGSGLTRRTVLELQADVRPGNSGGPFVLPDGRVGGMVFASSLRTSGIGYALAASELRHDLARAGTRPIATGACAA